MESLPDLSRTYRDIIILSGEIAAGDVFSAMIGCKGSSYLSFLDEQGNIVLYILAQTEDNKLTIASCYNEKWKKFYEKDIDFGRVDSIPIRIVFDKDEITISVNARSFSVDISTYIDITKICGLGEWLQCKFSKANEVDYDETLLVNTFFSCRKNLIWDIGMHNGNDTDYYLKKGFDVIALEANPLLARAGAIRFMDQIRSGRLIILNVGLSDKRGTFPFYVNRIHSEWSAFDQSVASRGCPIDDVQVETITPMDLFARYGVPYYVKIDIEASDYHVVLAISKLKQKPRYVSYELDSGESFELLRSAGYNHFKIVAQSTIAKTQLPEISKEGKSIRYKFKNGSSGPFGNDTPGPWLSPVEILKELAEVGKNNSRVSLNNYPEWYDMHASL
jgi:FkbM family methyltransferase